MKKLLVALSVALPIRGNGGEEKVANSDTNASAASPVADLAKTPVVENWTAWEANSTPFGGHEVLVVLLSGGLLLSLGL